MQAADKCCNIASELAVDSSVDKRAEHLIFPITAASPVENNPRMLSISREKYIRINHLKNIHTRSSVMLHDIYKEMQSRNILLTIHMAYNQSLDLKSVLYIAERQLGRNELIRVSVSGDSADVTYEILDEALAIMRRVLTNNFYTDGISQEKGPGSMEYLFRDLDRKKVQTSQRHKNFSSSPAIPIENVGELVKYLGEACRKDLAEQDYYSWRSTLFHWVETGIVSL
ncbi:MAG: HPr family phosphocarrier protein, partial [Candidatus Omnitrophota bacterium]|nr:HPr family phosphocarrier protein [Candidatus Omnitrophota bacterium]